ncbi:MAG: response regulator [Phycisphaerae bacterium]|nr:response regulator [Phycisphaerae bacterium]
MDAANRATGQIRRVLVLGAPAKTALLREALSACCEVSVIETADDALAALHARDFDAVVSTSDQFLPLARATGRAQAAMILETMGHGVCMVDHGGNLIWSNPKFQANTPAAIEAIRLAAAEMCRELMARQLTPDSTIQSHRSIDVASDQYFDVTASPIFDADNRVERAVVLVRDVTRTRQLERKLNAIDEAGRELVRLDAEALAQMDVNERLRLLEERIIRCSRDLMRFRHFTVRVLDEKTNRLEVLLAEGMSAQSRTRQIYATTEGNGISGYVAATGRSYICPDVSRDARVLPGIDPCRSSLTVPLHLHDRVIGTLNVESEEVAAFTEDDRQFAEIFGRYVAIALNTLQLLAVERHTTTGQVAADVVAELGAPLNDIVGHVSALIEDYIGHDDLRKRLNAIVDIVENARKRIHTLGKPVKLTGMADEMAETDPLLANKRVLIADDEDVIRETIADVLTRAGAVTTTAADGAEAISLVRAQHFDLVITDIKMPCCDGYQVFSAVRETAPDCRVILITGFGYDPDHSIVRASREGLSGVLFKPFKVDMLMSAARQALSGKSKN